MSRREVLKDQFIPYELAVKLKELGYNEVCLGVYNRERAFRFNNVYNPVDRTKSGFPTVNNGKIPVPLWQQAFDGFREKYELHSCILVLSKLKWAYVITNFTDYVDSDTQILKAFETYEEARQACLEKLIELCQQN